MTAVAARPEMFEQFTTHRFPQYETRTWPDVPAALAPFKDESLSAVAEEHPEQSRRGNVQVGGNARVFELLGLIRTSSRDESERRSVTENRICLFLADFGRQESQDPHTPGTILETRRRLRNYLFRFGPAH